MSANDSRIRPRSVSSSPLSAPSPTASHLPPAKRPREEKEDVAEPVSGLAFPASSSPSRTSRRALRRPPPLSIADRPPQPRAVSVPADSLAKDFTRLQQRFPQLCHTSLCMYEYREIKDFFRTSKREFTPFYNDASRVGVDDKGPPLVINSNQGGDIATPPPSPRIHSTLMRTAIPDNEYNPRQDLLVNLADNKFGDRRSTYNEYVPQYPKGKGMQRPKEPLIKADRNQIRMQAALTNDYLKSQGGSVKPSWGNNSKESKEFDKVAKNMLSRSRGRDCHKGKKASDNKPATLPGPNVFQDKTIGHVPDKWATNPKKAASQMGGLPMSRAANNVTGTDSGIRGIYSGQGHLYRFLVRERDNNIYLYHSRPVNEPVPALAAAAPEPALALPVSMATSSQVPVKPQSS